MADEYMGPERRVSPQSDIDRKAEEAAVWIRAREFADEQTQAIVNKAMMRAALGSFVAATIVAAVVALLLQDNLSTQARINARVAHMASVQNCRTAAASRPQGNLRALMLHEVLLVADSAFDQFPPNFKAAQNKQIRRDIRVNSLLLPPGISRDIQGFGDLGRAITLLPLVHCG